MFLTLNQALDMSPVGMAIVDTPYRQLVKICGDGTYKVIMAYQGQIFAHEKPVTELDKSNRKFVLQNINCRPVMEEVTA